MAQKGQQQKAKQSHKAGRNKIKCERYRNQRRRYKNKLRRVVRSNGAAAAQAYRDREAKA